MQRSLPPPPPPYCIARVAIASGRGVYTEEDQQEEREEGKTDRKNSGKKKTVGGRKMHFLGGTKSVSKLETWKIDRWSKPYV